MKKIPTDHFSRDEESEYRYFNVPIQLLENFIPETKKVLERIIYYALYKMTLNYEDSLPEEQIRGAKKFFDFHSEEDNYLIYEKGKEIYNSIPDRSPMVGIKTDITYDYYENDKTDFQKACFLGFVAIKSILQDKPYCKIDNQFWLSRMDGEPTSIDPSFLSPSIARFSSHYQTRKIKSELKSGWNLKEYSWRTRGFYVSFKLNLESLALEAEKRKKSYKGKLLKQEAKNARLSALEQLNKLNRNI